MAHDGGGFASQSGAGGLLAWLAAARGGRGKGKHRAARGERRGLEEVRMVMG